MISILSVVPPPPTAAESLPPRIDGFCVGEPWNSVAVADGSGTIIATEAELWAASPEKVLGMRAAFVDGSRGVAEKIIRALTQACLWLDVRSNRRAAADILARPEYVGIWRNVLAVPVWPAHARRCLRSSCCSITINFSGKASATFSVAVSHATWLLSQTTVGDPLRAPFNIAEVAQRASRLYLP